MPRPLTIEEAARHVHSLVRIDPRNKSIPHGQGKHWGRGKIAGVTRRSVLVVPFGHKGPVEIDAQYLKLWQTKDGTVVDAPTEEIAPMQQHAPSNGQHVTEPDGHEAAATTPAAVDRPAVARLKPLSEVLNDIAQLGQLAKSHEQDLARAEANLAMKQQELKDAEKDLLDIMGNQEKVKARVRNLRTALDQLVND